MSVSQHNDTVRSLNPKIEKNNKKAITLCRQTLLENDVDL